MASGRPAFMLDGDNLRHGSAETSASPSGTARENVRRAGEVGRMFAESGCAGPHLHHQPLRRGPPADPRRCTTRPGCRSSRSSWTPHSRSASAATPRASTSGPEPASCRASPVSMPPTRCRPTLISFSAPVQGLFPSKRPLVLASIDQLIPLTGSAVSTPSDRRRRRSTQSRPTASAARPKPGPVEGADPAPGAGRGDHRPAAGGGRVPGRRLHQRVAVASTAPGPLGLGVHTLLRLPAASALARGDGAAWVTDDLRNRLIRFDPTSGHLGPSVHLAGRPVALLLAGPDLWVAEMVSNTVDEYAASDLREIRSVPVRPARRAWPCSTGRSGSPRSSPAR